jgi:hypothetical protein
VHLILRCSTHFLKYFCASSYSSLAELIAGILYLNNFRPNKTTDATRHNYKAVTLHSPKYPQLENMSQHFNDLLYFTILTRFVGEFVLQKIYKFDLVFMLLKWKMF